MIFATFFLLDLIFGKCFTIREISLVIEFVNGLAVDGPIFTHAAVLAAVIEGSSVNVRISPTFRPISKK